MGKSYGSSRREIVFDIDGEQFTAWAIPGAVYLDFLAAFDDDADPAAQALVIKHAFASSMAPEEFERFWKRCSTDVDMATMTEILTDLASSSAGRPTPPSSPSVPGRRRAPVAAGSSARAPKSEPSDSGNSAT